MPYNLIIMSIELGWRVAAMRGMHINRCNNKIVVEGIVKTFLVFVA